MHNLASVVFSDLSWRTRLFSVNVHLVSRVNKSGDGVRVGRVAAAPSGARGQERDGPDREMVVGYPEEEVKVVDVVVGAAGGAAAAPAAGNQGAHIEAEKGCLASKYQVPYVLLK